MDENARAAGSEVGATDSSSEAGPDAETTRSPEEIRTDIEQTRAELGDTVEALAEKTDVKGQAKQRIAEIKGNVQHKREELTTKAKHATPESARQGGQQIAAKVRENPAPVALGVAALAGYVLWRLAGRRS
jgi:ElaB/YqjD/DUF883 family membrane-anchored ribosome-binding protein